MDHTVIKTILEGGEPLGFLAMFFYMTRVVVANTKAMTESNSSNNNLCDVIKDLKEEIRRD